MKTPRIIFGVLGALVLAAAAFTLGPVQRAVSQGMVQVTNLVGSEQISLNFPCTVSCYATSATLANYSQATPGGNTENVLVGGDMGTNLFQDGTSVGSVSTTITYVADQWAAWGGSTTVITGTQQTGSTDITTAYTASLRINKASGTGGTIPACVLQEVASADSTRFQGQTAEFDFHAKAGAGFSASPSALAVSIVTGTGVDEGISKLAFAFNAGGGGSSTWTGQANAASNLAVPITTTWARYTVVAPIPATATEIAVIICYTPVGNGGATDWFEFTGAQLVRNASLASVAGTAGAVLPANDTRAKSFARRLGSDETRVEYSYYYRVNESSTTIFQRALCANSSSSLAVCLLDFPTSMRIAPTMSYTAGFKLSVAAQTSTVTCTALRTSTTLTGAAATNKNVPIDCTSAAGFGGAGTASQLYDAGTGTPAGVIIASARF